MVPSCRVRLDVNSQAAGRHQAARITLMLVATKLKGLLGNVEGGRGEEDGPQWPGQEKNGRGWGGGHVDDADGGVGVADGQRDGGTTLAVLQRNGSGTAIALIIHGCDFDGSPEVLAPLASLPAAVTTVRDCEEGVMH